MSARFRLAADIAPVVCDDTTVLGRLPDGPVWVLEGTAAIIAGQLGTPATVDSLVEHVAGVFEADRAEIEEGVRAFVESMRGAGLLAPVDADSAEAVSRRP